VSAAKKKRATREAPDESARRIAVGRTSSGEGKAKNLYKIQNLHSEERSHPTDNCSQQAPLNI
jgi:hypothetical protein